MSFISKHKKDCNKKNRLVQIFHRKRNANYVFKVLNVYIMHRTTQLIMKNNEFEVDLIQQSFYFKYKNEMEASHSDL